MLAFSDFFSLLSSNIRVPPNINIFMSLEKLGDSGSQIFFASCTFFNAPIIYAWYDIGMWEVWVISSLPFNLRVQVLSSHTFAELFKAMYILSKLWYSEDIIRPRKLIYWGNILPSTYSFSRAVDHKFSCMHFQCLGFCTLECHITCPSWSTRSIFILIFACNFG